MLKLRSSPASPFGRKVKISAAALGLSERIEVVATDTSAPGDPIRILNPLGKIPALELEDGTTLFDSRVIVDYLDFLAGGGKLVPVEAPGRFQELRAQALADGLCDAALLQVYETRLRDADKRSERWLELQAGKVERALKSLESQPPANLSRIGAIATACALGYLDLRFDGAWRSDHPSLVAWLEDFRAATPAFEATAPH
ncbi:glutathione S-transferase N-terminal domain-containing protein [Hansschlegelia zhihuaiae]|uniref:Glutathione S-transferase family protein n=1 Tax=Hansschlegelia zhihuaiae TaxID=405005 RepID=A0A4Q0MKF8_9HYPH|nr:glutathione S-transferase N-terminal domain-containing protein [Hansschlegelia zhihuaiae]RXF73569.1 glutathione S-transferase family protein [Hansschlegelia zhihuaiae]